MSKETTYRPGADRAQLRGDLVLLVSLALLKILINGIFIGRYGIQRDELYFIVCGQHLDFGYVDHSPLLPWLARLSVALFGLSTYGLRVFPLLAGGFTVFLTGWLARELGGNRFAQLVAVTAAIIAPAYLRVDSILHIPTFEVVFWSLDFLMLVRIVKRDEPRLWLLFGVVAGVGLMTKPTMLFLGAGVVVGLALTPYRKYFLSPWLWAGGIIAFLIYLPNLYWQWHHDWATYRFVSRLNRETMSHIPPAMFLLGQLLYMNPLNALVWIPGLGYLLVSRNAKPFRMFGWIFLTIIAIFLITRAKVYYLAPAYPILFAAGGVAIQRGIAATKMPVLKPVAISLLVAAGLWLAPIGLPALPLETAFKYMQTATGGFVNTMTAYEITGDWRDQYGWQDHAATIAEVFHALSPDEQQACTIFAGNYGEASAVNVYGPQYGLPPAVSASMSYYYWGPGDRPAQLAIAYGISREELNEFFSEVTQKATILPGRTLAKERNLPVYLCRNPRQPLKNAWSMVKPSGF